MKTKEEIIESLERYRSTAEWWREHLDTLEVGSKGWESAVMRIKANDDFACLLEWVLGDYECESDEDDKKGQP